MPTFSRPQNLQYAMDKCDSRVGRGNLVNEALVLLGIHPAGASRQGHCAGTAAPEGARVKTCCHRAGAETKKDLAPVRKGSQHLCLLRGEALAQLGQHVCLPCSGAPLKELCESLHAGVPAVVLGIASRDKYFSVPYISNPPTRRRRQGPHRVLLLDGDQCGLRGQEHRQLRVHPLPLHHTPRASLLKVILQAEVRASHSAREGEKRERGNWERDWERTTMNVVTDTIQALRSMRKRQV